MPRTARKRAKTAWKRNPRYRGLRPWKKGQSGNPAGRPKGSRNKVHHRLAMDELVNLTKSKRAPAAVKLRATRIFLEIIMRTAGLWDQRHRDGGGLMSHMKADHTPVEDVDRIAQEAGVKTIVLSHLSRPSTASATRPGAPQR